MKCFVHFLLAALLVTATAYTPYEPGCDGIGSLGQPVIPGKTIAVSRDLKHLLGKWVHIDGVGRRFVNDLMAKRWKQKIDLCVANDKAADNWGIRTVKLRVAE